MNPNEIELSTKHFSELFEKLWQERFGDASQPRSAWSSEERSRYDADMQRLDAHMERLDKQWSRLSWLYQTEARGADQRLQMAAALQKSSSSQDRLVPEFVQTREALLEVKRALTELRTDLDFRDRAGQSELVRVKEALVVVKGALEALERRFSDRTEANVRESIREASAANKLPPREEDSGAHHSPSRIGWRELRSSIHEFRLMSTGAKLILVLLVALAVGAIGLVYLIKTGGAGGH